MKLLSKFALTIGLVAGMTAAAQAQTIAFSGFEPSGDTWTGVTLSGTGGSFSTTVGATDTPANQRILSGSQSFQTNNGSATVDFDVIDTSAFTGPFQLTLRLSGTSINSTNGVDLTDTLRIFVALNGSLFSVAPDITITGNNNARYGYNATLTASTTAGVPLSFAAPQGGTNTNNYSTAVVNIPAGTTMVDLRLLTLNNDANEVWNVDNVTLSVVPEPSVYMLLGVGLLFCGQRFLRRKRA